MENRMETTIMGYILGSKRSFKHRSFAGGLDTKPRVGLFQSPPFHPANHDLFVRMQCYPYKPYISLVSIACSMFFYI